MHRRTTAAAITALLVILTGCSSTDGEPKPEPPKSSATGNSDADKAAGIPPEPTGAKRTALLAALKAIDPALVADEDKAITNARNQCSSITGGGNADASAKARFTTSDHEVTDTEAKAINAALKGTLCP